MMVNESQQQVSNGQKGSLQALLASIDRETAPALKRDADFLKERSTRNLRRKKPYISFMLGSNEMALPLQSVQEIGYLPTITPLPNLPSWIRGITQIRGEVLSVVDFLVLFGLSDVRGVSLKRSYILFRQQDFKFCLMVNRITGVVNFDELHDSLGVFSSEQGDNLTQLSFFFKGILTVDQRKVCILDSEKLGNASMIRKWQ
jgi:purine-binding chemotaxis protein CheW